MKTNKIKEPWECGMKGSLMNLQLDEDLMKRSRMPKINVKKKKDLMVDVDLFYSLMVVNNIVCLLQGYCR
jgi:hypothetical protein